MAPPAGASAAKTSSRRSKKTGVPSREKLSKALGIVSSQASAASERDERNSKSKRKSSSSSSRRPPKVDVSSPSQEATEQQHHHVRSPLQKVQSSSPSHTSASMASSSDQPSSNSFLSTFFSSRASTQQENVPSPRAKATAVSWSSKPVSPRRRAAAALKKSREQQLKKTGGSGLPLTPRASIAAVAVAAEKIKKPPLTAVQAAAIAAEKIKRSCSSKKPPLTAVHAAAIAAEKIKRSCSSKKKEKTMSNQQKNTNTKASSISISSTQPQPDIIVTKTSSEDVLASVAPSLDPYITSSSKQQQKNRSSSSSSSSTYYYQEDVDAALKFSSDIEKDIQATSQTLANISEFIDTVASPTKGTTRTVASYALPKEEEEDDTVDSCAAIKEEDSDIYEEREPAAATRGAVAAAEAQASTREGSSPSEKMERQEYTAPSSREETYSTEYKKPDPATVASYGSKAKPYKDMEMHDHHIPAETRVYHAAINKHRQQSPIMAAYSNKASKSNNSSLDALLQMASDGNFDNFAAATEGQAASKITTYAQNHDPPDMALEPNTMGSMDELQEKKSVESFGSQDSSDNTGAVSNPDILSKISAFIDQVERKNKPPKTKKKSSSDHQKAASVEKLDPLLDALRMSSFDAATLAHIFDEPVSPQKKRAQAAKKKKAEEERAEMKFSNSGKRVPSGDRSIDPKQSELTVDDLPSLCSSLAEKESPAWAEIEKLIKDISEQKGSDAQESGGGPKSEGDNRIEATIANESSKAFDPVCQIRGDLERRPPMEPTSLRVADPEDSKRRLPMEPTPGVRFERGFDPPAETDTEANARTRADPPAETKSLEHDEGSYQAKGSPKKEPSRKETNDESTEEAPKPFRPKAPPKPEDIMTSPRVNSAGHLNTEATGAETASIVIEDKTEPFVVDLTQVASDEVDTPFLVQFQTPAKTSEETELDTVDQVAELEKLLVVADSPKKGASSRRGTAGSKNICTADSEDRAGSDLDTRNIPSNEMVGPGAGIVFETTDGNSFEGVLSDDDNYLLSHLKRTEDIEDHEDRLQPPGDYSGSGESDSENDAEVDCDVHGEKKVEVDRGANQNTKTDPLQGLVASLPAMAEADDDHDRFQSLVFARNNLGEEKDLRNAAGLSLVQLTLDEVKGFVDSDLAESGDVSIEQIREIEELDQRVPSLSDLAGDASATRWPKIGISPSRSAQINSRDESVEQSQIERHTPDTERPFSEVQEDILVSYKFEPVSYKFEPTEKLPIFFPGQSTNPFMKSPDNDKKGMKRKFSRGSKNEGVPKRTEFPTPDAATWLDTLDNIFVCKKPNQAKNNIVSFTNDMVGSEALDEEVANRSIGSTGKQNEGGPEPLANIAGKQNEEGPEPLANALVSRDQDESTRTPEVSERDLETKDEPQIKDTHDDVEVVSSTTLPKNEEDLVLEKEANVIVLDFSSSTEVVSSSVDATLPPPENEEEGLVPEQEANVIVIDITSSTEQSLDELPESINEELDSTIEEAESAGEEPELTVEESEQVVKEADSTHEESAVKDSKDDELGSDDQHLQTQAPGERPEICLSPRSDSLEKPIDSPVSQTESGEPEEDTAEQQKETQTIHVPVMEDNPVIELDTTLCNFPTSSQVYHKKFTPEEEGEVVDSEPQKDSSEPFAEPELHPDDQKGASESPEEPTLPQQGNGWEKFVDLTNLDDGDETVHDDPVNAWETPFNLGLQQDSLEVLSWEKTLKQPQQNQTMEDPEVLDAARQEIDVAANTPKGDQTPRMHQNKRFDFIEDVDESDNISAYFSRMSTLKKGGHLPGLNTKAMGSFDEKNPEDDVDCIEVDIDVGFVKKSLAPSLSNEHNSWEDDRKDDTTELNRYISIEESIVELPADRVILDTIPDDESDSERLIEQKSASRTSTVPSSKASPLTEDESLAVSVQAPTVVESASSGLAAILDEEFDADPAPLGLSGYRQSLSYESSNDDWLRKNDLATRKTQKPTMSWLSRTTSGIQNKLSFATVETPKSINGVAAAKKLCMRTTRTRGGRRRNPIPSTGSWKLSYKERTKDHAGYFDIHFFSIFESSAVGALQPHRLDAAPWEGRDVRQHFLHDHSISLSKNWFGKAHRTRGNDRVKERTAHPKSMEMPMENKPHPEEWTTEWYKTWKRPETTKSGSRSIDSSYSGSESSSRSGTDGSGTRQDDESSFMGKSESRSSHHTESGASGGSYSTSRGGSSRSDVDDYTYDPDDSTYYLDDDDAPQCGTIINVKPKIGERVSRIHPDYTSQLRHSRWRKKYFPRGAFPYDK